MRLDPHERLTQRDKCYDVEDPARRQVMQLDLIITMQVEEELMA
jgi:hypothetical protein